VPPGLLPGGAAAGAKWLGDVGQDAQAADQYRELLTDDLRILGPDHPHTHTTRRQWSVNPSVWCHLRHSYLACVCGWSMNRQCVHDRRSARFEERRDQREHLAGPPGKADMCGAREYCELRVRQELEHLHHIWQR
jgi:hypothetical protein